ncbi:MAG: hypothetical protein GY774_15620 [Planctomycetes bacterium]|nr:hypothetical protein [Planctomycetota bacterium]
MKSIATVVLFITSIVFLTSCEKKIDNALSDPRPAIQNTIFTAKPTKGGESLTSPIIKSYTNETPPRYQMKHEFGNLGIEVGYQYIGQGIVNDNSRVDVYLISLKIGNNPTEYEAVFYKGGNKVVVDCPEIVISFNQDRANN